MSSKPLIFTVLACMTVCISTPLVANTKVNTLVNNGDGSVTDTATGLTWQRQDDGVVRSHAAAVSYCGGLSLAGQSDWRLPNIKELLTVVDHRVTLPSIDDAMFSNSSSASYWSASSRASDSTSAWFVGFGVGNVNSTNKSNNLLVRCVR